MHNYYIPINVPEEGVSQTLHCITIDGCRKRRKREFAKYVKAAYGITNARKFAQQMGFKDLT